MKKFKDMVQGAAWMLAAVLSIGLTFDVLAQVGVGPGGFLFDANGNLNVTLGTLLSGEDQTNNVMRVEGQFSYFAPVVADAQVKASAGFLHCIWITQNDDAPTAGTIVIYDNTAESGTQVFNWTLTTAVFNPIVLCPDIVMTTGIYIGFTTTADVNVSVSYR